MTNTEKGQQESSQQEPGQQVPRTKEVQEVITDEEVILTKEDESEVKASVASGEKDQIRGQKFGTFSGVFRPTILTILGVMMYLREGWVVGNAGLLGSLLIIGMTYVITGTAALSISSITTNIRLGAGGVFSIVSQSLGLEVGGSIGIPFYLAQSLSTAMYIYGFMEGWLYLFPHHPPLLIISAVFLLVFILSYISASLAFRVQYVVMVGVVLALGSIFWGIEKLPEVHQPELWGTFEQAGYWELFAVFFPAATGVMVGASMSGNLKKPKRSIPLGTMGAWGLSSLIYISLAVWYSLVASPEELREQLVIAVDRSYWGPAVLIGILSSCFTAALSSFVAAPRILQSLGAHKILPYSSFLEKLHKGEPRNGILVTGVLVLLVLFVGDLNAIAQVLTVIFLLTYFTINTVLVIEQKLNLISFRPTFSIPSWVPLLGGVSCLSAILIISPFLGLLAIVISIGIYIYLSRSGLKYPVETIRSSLFEGVAYWAAKKVAINFSGNTKRAWKPVLLIPVESTSQVVGLFRLMRALIYSQGAVHIVGLKKEGDLSPFLNWKEVIKEMHEEDLFASSAIVESTDYTSSLKTSIAIMKGAFFQPNIIFSLVEQRSQEELQATLTLAKWNKMGAVLFANHQETGLGKGRKINMWVRDPSPQWSLSFALSSIDLSLLLSYKLMNNWNLKMRVICILNDSEDLERANHYLRNLLNLARIPNQVEIHVEVGNFMECLKKVPQADLNVFGLADTVDKEFLQLAKRTTQSSCLFVHSSGLESALA